MGAKMAEPDKLAIAVIGDYGFGMVGMDIETAVRENIPILTIILNNSTMGIYTANRFPTAHELYGTKTTGGDYVKMAESMGCYSERVDNPSEIIAAIQRCAEITKTGQPALLEIVTDGTVQEMSYRGF
jgi:thiamine pyrophosphate-dependent acetolactate synthase large subunit-like protein